MTKYHINYETGRPNKCTATVRNCKYAVDGKMPEHYETKEEAKLAYERSQYVNMFKTVKKKTPTEQKMESADIFVRQIGLYHEFPINVPDISSPYKFEKFKNKISNERFELAYVGDESIVFKDKINGELVKTYRRSYDENYLHKFNTNKTFYEKYKNEDICINGSVYRIPETSFCLIDNRYPVIVQDDLSDLDMGYINFKDSTELFKKGFDDLRNENTKMGSDGTVYLLDCFPE